MSEENKKQQEVKVKIRDDHTPVFSNSAQINVSNDEVALQFLYIRRNTGQGTLLSEIILTPQHAIKFQKALDETIKKHFTKHLPK